MLDQGRPHDAKHLLVYSGYTVMITQGGLAWLVHPPAWASCLENGGCADHSLIASQAWNRTQLFMTRDSGLIAYYGELRFALSHFTKQRDIKDQEVL